MVGSGPAGLAAALRAQSRRLQRHRLREGRAAGRHPALRHPRLQAREVGARPACRPHEARRRGLRVRRRCGRGRLVPLPSRPFRRDRPCRRRGCPARSRGTGARAGRHPFRHGLPDPAEQATSASESLGGAAHHGRGQERGGHRRRRHRLRLHRHVVAPRGPATWCSSRSCPSRPATRSESTPWPQWPLMRRDSSSHKEGGTRLLERRHDGLHRRTGPGEARPLRPGRVACRRESRAARAPARSPGSDFTLDADLVLIAMGFVGPSRTELVEEPRRREGRPRLHRLRRQAT